MESKFYDPEKEVEKFYKFIKPEVLAFGVTDRNIVKATEIVECWNHFYNAFPYKMFLPMFLVHDWNHPQEAAVKVQDKILCTMCWSYEHGYFEVEIEDGEYSELDDKIMHLVHFSFINKKIKDKNMFEHYSVCYLEKLDKHSTQLAVMMDFFMHEDRIRRNIIPKGY